MQVETRMYELTSNGLKPMTKGTLPIGQKVEYAHTGEIGVICGSEIAGYLVIFPDGSAHNGQREGSLSPYTRIRPVDADDIVDEPIVSLEEVERLKALMLEKRASDQREREEASRQKAIETERLTKELRAKYPWAIPLDGKLSSYARAAKNLKIELSRTFPGVKFSVKSESYAGGNAIRVNWTLGPTSEQIEEVSSKYNQGSFDGMQDLYEYDSSAYGDAIESVLGRAKYVTESRHYPDGLFEQIGRDLCALQQVEYAGGWTRNLCGEGDTFELNSHIHQLLGRTSFDVGEEYAGVEHTPNEESKSAWDWCRIVKIKPATVETFAAPSPIRCPVCKVGTINKILDTYSCNSCAFTAKEKAKSVTITENTEKGGIEIRFASRPSDDMLASLKASGWRWSRFNSCWYAKATEKAREFANSLL